MFLFGKRKKNQPPIETKRPPLPDFAVKADAGPKDAELCTIVQEIVDKLGVQRRSANVANAGWIQYKDKLIEIIHYVSIGSGYEMIEVTVPGLTPGSRVYKIGCGTHQAKYWKVEVHHTGDWERYLREVLYPKTRNLPLPSYDFRAFCAVDDSAIFKDVLEAKTDKTST